MLCSSCCKVNLPILYKTGVDINDFSKIIDLQTEQDYGTNEEESKEMDGAHQLEAIASSEVEIGHMISPKSSTCKLSKIMVPMRKAKEWMVPINSKQQMQIDTLKLQVETLTTQVFELRQNQQSKTHQLESIASSVCETNPATISDNKSAN